jgi:hypothetical protein
MEFFRSLAAVLFSIAAEAAEKRQRRKAALAAY